MAKLAFFEKEIWHILKHKEILIFQWFYDKVKNKSYKRIEENVKSNLVIEILILKLQIKSGQQTSLI